VKVRFWVILCPLNFVGRIRDSIGDMVGRCSLTASKPVLKAPMISAPETIIAYTAFKLCFQFQLAPLQHGEEIRLPGWYGGAGGPGIGRAVQVDPINPTLKAPGTKRLKP